MSNNPRGRKWKTLSECPQKVGKSRSRTFSSPLVSGCCCTFMRPPTNAALGSPQCKSAIFFVLQVTELHRSPLATALGMALCSSHYMFLINTQETNKILKKTHSHFFDTERKGGFVFLILRGFSYWVTALPGKG